MDSIDTLYKGCRFRSRLEARWAIWLDALGITWQYEFQGFDLDDAGPYLPDFWLPFLEGRPFPEGKPPHAGFWLEIKPVPLSDQEEDKLQALAIHTGHRAYAFAGDPWPGEFAVHRTFSHTRHKQAFYVPFLCSTCGGSGFLPGSIVKEWRGRTYDVNVWSSCDACVGGFLKPSCWMQAMLGGIFCNTVVGNVTDDHLRAAFRAARSARFEHGETPR